MWGSTQGTLRPLPEPKPRVRCLAEPPGALEDVHTETYTWISRAALFLGVKNWKQDVRPPYDEVLFSHKKE